MRALSYLFLTTLKNNLKELVHSAGKLILTLLMLAALALVLIGGSMGGGELPPRSPLEVPAMALALYLSVFLTSCFTGLSSGGSFYRMQDVNFLFPAPVSPKHILFYGLIKQAGTSLMVGFFLIFQYAWLNNLYGISILDLVYILLGYGVVIFSANLTAVFLYSVSSYQESRKRVFKGLLIALALAALAWAVLPDLGKPMEALLAGAVGRANSLPLQAFPLVGWAAAAVAAAMAGQVLPALLWTLACLAFVAVIVLLILKTNADFYEDVLQATERGYSAIAAAKSGKVQESIPANVKVGKSGFSRGKGATAFFFKQMRENRRTRFFLLDTTNLIFVAITVIFGLVMNGEGEGSLVGVFVMSVYMQLFSITTGRWIKELVYPYVYLAPVPAFRKLLGVCAESVLRIVAECVLLFAVLAIFFPMTPGLFCTLVLARISFGLLFVAGNLLIERLLGGLVNKVLIMTLYFIILMVLCIPGIVVGVLIGAWLQMTDLTTPILLSITGVNAAISLLLTFLCRDILNYAELNNR